MALVRLDGKIISISGTCGGDVWKRDASGQHITAKQRHVKKPRSTEQQEQNDWYGEKKKHEHNDTTPDPDDMDPPPGTAFAILRPETIFYFLQRSILKPDMHSTELAGDPLWDIKFWLDHNPDGWQNIPLITYDWALMFMCKWWWEAYTLSGGTPELGLWNAITKMGQASAYCAAGTSASTIVLFSIFVALAAYAAYATFYSREYIHHDFPMYAILLLNVSGTFWGRIYHRHSEKMFDILPGPPIIVPGLLHVKSNDPYYYGIHDWHYSELYETLLDKLYHWNTYQWERLRTHFICDGYQTGTPFIRAKMPYVFIADYHPPIGWTYDGTTPFDFVDDMFDETPW